MAQTSEEVDQVPGRLGEQTVHETGDEQGDCSGGGSRHGGKSIAYRLFLEKRLTFPPGSTALNLSFSVVFFLLSSDLGTKKGG
jgi:hypothetical protein